MSLTLTEQVQAAAGWIGKLRTEIGKVTRKVVRVVRRVYVPAKTTFERQTRYSTRLITAPGTIRVVRRLITKFVPVVRKRVVTVNGKSRTVVETKLVPTTRVETETRVVTNNQTVTDTQNVTQAITTTQHETKTVPTTVTQHETTTVTDHETTTVEKTVTENREPLPTVEVRSIGWSSSAHRRSTMASPSPSPPCRFSPARR